MSGTLAQPMGAPAQMQIQQVIDRMASLFGAVKGLPTSADLARKPGIQPVNDWNVVDAAYNNRFLATLSTMATAAMMNQYWGQPLVAVCTQIILSWDRQWSTQFEEVYQWAWSEISATGIPHTVQFRTWKEVGGSNRYGQYFELPNASLVDPNFGLARLLELSEAMKTTYDYTIMTKTAMALAMAPMRNTMKRLIAEDRLYSYAEHYDFTTRNFCLGALRPSYLIGELDKMLSAMPRKDTVIVPDGHAHTLESITTQGGRWMYHVNDKTDNSILAGTQLKDLYTDPIAKLTVNGTQANLILCPSFMSTNPEAEHHREQALRRQATLARSYVFPSRQYGPLTPLDSRALSVPVLNIDRRNAAWKLMRLGQTIEESNCGGYFQTPDGPYSPEFMRYVYDLNGNSDAEVTTGAIDRLTKMLQDLDNARDLDHPGQHAADQIGQFHNANERPATGEMNLWRELSSFVHIERDKDGKLRRAATNQFIIQQHEAMFPTAVAIDQARSAIGMGADQANRHLAGILGCSITAAADLLKFVSQYNVTFNGDEAQQSIALYRGLINKRANLAGIAKTVFAKNEFEQKVKDVKDTAAKKSTTPPVSKVLKSGVVLSVKLADGAFDILSPHFATLARLQQESPEVAKEVLGVMEKRFAAHASDAGASEVVAKHLAEKLTEMGLGAHDVSLETMAVPSAEQVKAFKRAVPSAKDLSAASRPASEADFGKSTAYQSLAGAPFAAKITEDQNTDTGIDENAERDEDKRIQKMVDGIKDRDALMKDLLADEDLAPAADGSIKFYTTQVYIPEDRLYAMRRAFEGCAPDETLVALAILLAPMTPRVLARLANYGIQIIQGSLERYAEQYIVSSALVMKAGGDTVETIMTPVMAQVTSRGIQKVMVFDYMFDMGHRFKNWDGIQELFGIFPYALAGGTGTLVCRSVQEIRSIFQPTRTSRATQRDLVFVPRPYTETRLEYPCNLFGNAEVQAARSFAPENFFHRKNTGHVVLRAMLGRDFIEEAAAHLETSVLQSHAMLPNPYCPFVERAATYYYNEGQKDFSNQESGTGPLGPMQLNNYEWVATVFGAGRGTFPDTWPTRANV